MEQKKLAQTYAVESCFLNFDLGPLKIFRMILYNVTVKVELEAAAEWLAWMKQEHIPDLMGTGMFEDARIFRLLEQEEGDGLTYSIQYSCKDLEAYNKYIDEFALEMRERALKKFGGRFVAFRTIMEEA